MVVGRPSAPPAPPLEAEEDLWAEEEEEEEEEDGWGSVVCCVCSDGGDAAHLIECDAGCGRWWHTRCVDPPLPAVPRGRWACPRCCEKRDDPRPELARIGDIVFAKFEQFPWWPARVISFGKSQIGLVSAEVPRRGNLTGRSVAVDFVARDLEGQVDALRIVPFSVGLETLGNWGAANRGNAAVDPSCTSELFEKAVAEALEDAAERDAAIFRLTVPQAKKRFQKKDVVVSRDNNNTSSKKTAERSSADEARRWVGAMRRHGVDMETAAAVATSRLGWSKQRADDLVRRVYDEPPLRRRPAPDEPPTTGRRTDDDGEPFYERKFKIGDRPTKRQQAMMISSASDLQQQQQQQQQQQPHHHHHHHPNTTSVVLLRNKSDTCRRRREKKRKTISPEEEEEDDDDDDDDDDDFEEEASD
ncbi:hypothetical protein CTAYLR_002841 [Chrysophaeum taylorii]|uniref:Uncharacterized protein n=1 Tax=Chrysophaeum taylorii TaxID=2483200 RepID=A0AAD7XIT1_9STRA|nr:hypothetical protein CTAYLR_002841 [Chrysophaeum taylorii]